MLRLVKFTEGQTYMFPSGEIATSQIISEKCSAVLHFPHVLEINGDVCQAIMSIKALRNIHNINASLTDDEAIAALETIINTPSVVEPSPEERIAAAMEYQNLLSL